MNVKINAGTVGGKFRMVAIKPDGTERILADWFDNLITDAGMDRMATGGAVMSQAVVGSSNAAPTNSNVAMGTLVAMTGAVTAGVQGNASSAPYFGWYRKTFRFAVGTAAGTLREVGVAWDYGSGGLFSRALIKDSAGDPTEVVVLADEVLDVTYELRLYPPAADSTFDVEISGVTYSCVLRAASVTGNEWTPLQQAGAGGYPIARCYSGDIGSVTQSPSGTQNLVGLTLGTYATGSFSLDIDITAQLTDANFAGGVKSVLFSSGWLGSFQCSFTPAIPKDGNKVLVLNTTISWDRHTG